MGKKLDIIGVRFASVTVISESSDRSSSGKVLFNCLCDCGEHFCAIGSNLKTGNTRDCGCGRLRSQTSHNMSKSKIYSVWASMKNRCTSKGSPNYVNYGARGITYDSGWETFEGFCREMGESYQDGLSLDRIDNDKGYSKDNCRWTSKQVQSRNRRKRKNTSSQYRGVSFDRRSGKFVARARTLNGKSVHIGVYNDEVSAAKAYDLFVKTNNLPDIVNFN